jgi:hypothetical protein
MTSQSSLQLVQALARLQLELVTKMQEGKAPNLTTIVSYAAVVAAATEVLNGETAST